ncbi:MAG: hypothetical protein QM484_14450, partial [Woeseiaceae bacterium]
SKETILKNRNITIKRFKAGQIAYTETPLGACLTTHPCDKKAMRAISSCISCDKAVIKLSKLTKIINIQSLLVESFYKTSIEHRIELEQLNDFIRMKNQIINKENNVNTD